MLIAAQTGIPVVTSHSLAGDDGSLITPPLYPVFQGEPVIVQCADAKEADWLFDVLRTIAETDDAAEVAASRNDPDGTVVWARSPEREEE